MEKIKFRLELSSSFLHIFAMLCMLLDHMWATLLPNYEWLTCVGRIAFPIFAFMIVEGYFHTHDLKKYMLRLLIFAVISEVPFDMMYNGTMIYPFHQNVMWTFLISLTGIWCIEKAKEKRALWQTIVISAVIILVTFLAGFAIMVDYYGTGILTVYAFYFFRNRNLLGYLGQLTCMYIINVNMLGGYYYPIKIGGYEFELMQQGIALFALIPIWLYRGKQGYHSKWFQYFCYGFYPGHIIALVALGYLMAK